MSDAELWADEEEEEWPDEVELFFDGDGPERYQREVFGQAVEDEGPVGSEEQEAFPVFVIECYCGEVLFLNQVEDGDEIGDDDGIVKGKDPQDAVAVES